MKRHVVWTLFLAAGLMSLPAEAKDRDRDDRTCSNADLEGDWGTTMTGTVLHPTAGAILFAAVNHATYDADGNYWGTQTRTMGGTASHLTFKGTYVLKPDCTGTKTTRSYDQSGALTNTVVQDFVLVNDGNELSEIMISNTAANGANIPVVITGNSKRMFPHGDHEGHGHDR